MKIRDSSKYLLRFLPKIFEVEIRANISSKSPTNKLETNFGKFSKNK